MKRIYHVLINPISGCGSGAKVGKTITDLLEKNQFTYFTYETRYPNHELEIVQELLDQNRLEAFPESRSLGREEKFPMLVVVGGDGTLHHVVNQLHAYGANYPVAFISAGKENDFSRALKIPLNPTERFWQIIETRKPHMVSLLQYKDGIQEDQQVFLNSFGIGLDAKIFKKITNTMKKRKKTTFSRITFVRSVLVAMFQQASFPIRFELNGQKIEYKNAKLCTVTNHPYLGGGVPIISNTELSKEGFELVVVERLPLYKNIALLFRILRTKELDSPHFHRYSLKKLRIITTSLEETQIDGETLGNRCYDLIFSVTKQSFW